MTQENGRIRIARRLSVITIAVITAVIVSACGAPATSPSAQNASTQAPAETEAPASTDAPMATEAPTDAPASTDAPGASEAPTAAPAEAATEAPAAGTGGAVSFSGDVMPIFENSCIKCHGGEDGVKGGLDLRTHETLMKGGDEGPDIVPGDADNSMLVELIREGKMPKRGRKLPQEQIDLIAQWVNEGAQNN